MSKLGISWETLGSLVVLFAVIYWAACGGAGAPQALPDFNLSVSPSHISVADRSRSERRFFDCRRENERFFRAESSAAQTICSRKWTLLAENMWAGGWISILQKEVGDEMRQ